VPEDERYSLTELADLAGVTPRTVRYYLAQGLLPAVGQSGPGAKYDDRHFARLRLIRRLQAEHLPLAEIRRRLDELGDDEIGELAGSTQPPAPRDSWPARPPRSLGGGSRTSGSASRRRFAPMA
jgi:DNA-binding transcriptional MerR regulator